MKDKISGLNAVQNKNISYSFPLTGSPFSGIISENNRMRGMNMSLILAGRAKDGLVFVSDSKCTIANPDGVGYQEQGRIAKKVFSCNDFILATYGINELIINNNRVFIEDVINDILLSINPASVSDFCKAFRNVAMQYAAFASGKVSYNFLFGYRSQSGFDYVMHHVCLTNNEFNDSHMYMNPAIPVVALGDSKFFMNDFYSNINRNLSTQEMLSHLEKLMESMIQIGDALLPYNSIGEPIDKVVLQ